jgi:hypothetical protein
MVVVRNKNIHLLKHLDECKNTFNVLAINKQMDIIHNIEITIGENATFMLSSIRHLHHQCCVFGCLLA